VLTIEFCNRQSRLAVPEARWSRLLEEVLRTEGRTRAEVSVTVVDDDEMHALNRQYLAHDYPTDVLSFVLEEGSGSLCGEIIVSADTAAARASEFGWSVEDELTMYVLHGALHLVGYDDKEDEKRRRMRERERFYLSRFGMQARSSENGPTESDD